LGPASTIHNTIAPAHVNGLNRSLSSRGRVRQRGSRSGGLDVASESPIGSGPIRLRTYFQCIAPEPLYPLVVLANKTELGYEFWDREARTGRLEYVQPAGKNGTRYTSDSAYAKWYRGSLGRAQLETAKPMTVRRPERDLAGFRP
jgi:hypothetical protein